MSHKETPGEIFKRALANAARSLAEQPDLEVVFSGDGPSLVSSLPAPVTLTRLTVRPVGEDVLMTAYIHEP